MLRRGGGRAAYGGRAGYGGRACGREGERAGLEGGWVGRAGGRVRDMWRHALAALGEEEQEEVQVEEVDIKKLYRVTALRAHRAPPRAFHSSCDQHGSVHHTQRRFQYNYKIMARFVA